jgi:hypothetical protein
MNVTPYEKQQMREKLQAALAIVETLPEHTPCAACENFDANSSRCAHWQTVVPAEAQAVGCDQWGYLPF